MENYVVQIFERGVMLWIDQVGFSWESGVILVLFQDDMTFTQLSDTWEPEEPEPSPQVPPSDLYEPRGRFGKAWREGADLKARLGWAIEPEKKGGGWSPDPAEALNGAAQSFQRGVMYWIPYNAGTPEYTEDMWIYVLATSSPDGSPRNEWLAFIDTWKD